MLERLLENLTISIGGRNYPVTIGFVFFSSGSLRKTYFICLGYVFVFLFDISFPISFLDFWQSRVYE